MEMSLSWNRIGKTGAVALVQAPGWTALNLSWNSNLGYAGLQSVAQALMRQGTEIASLSRNQAFQQQRLDLSHTVKLKSGGGGFRVNSSNSSNNTKKTNTDDEKAQLRVRKSARDAVITALQHSYRLIEFQVEGCELLDDDGIEEAQIQFYTSWNRQGRYLLLLRDQEPELATCRDNCDICSSRQGATAARNLYHAIMPTGLWSLVLAKISDKSSLVYAFIREQPHLIPVTPL
jgi:hypothetical protein